MPYGPTPRLGLYAPLGGEQINQGDDKLRALVDQLDAVLAPFSFGLLSARPTSTSGTPGIQGRRYRATDVFTTFRDTGTSWEIESQTPQIVTSLPSGTGIPFDGQEIYFLADATNGIVWHLRYRAAATGSYRWEYVGGHALFSEVPTSESLNTATYSDLTTVGPSVVAPLAGQYRIAYGAHLLSGASDSMWMSVMIGATNAVDADGIRLTQQSTVGFPLSRELSAKTAAAGDTIKARYRTGGSQTGSAMNRFLRATPIRVG